MPVAVIEGMRKRPYQRHNGGVGFAACEYTMRKQKVRREQLPPFDTTAGSGVAEVVRGRGVARQFAGGVEALRSELRESDAARSAALVSQLKPLLIRATPTKLRQQDHPSPPVAHAPPGVGESRGRRAGLDVATEPMR